MRKSRAQRALDRLLFILLMPLAFLYTLLVLIPAIPIALVMWITSPNAYTDYFDYYSDILFWVPNMVEKLLDSY